MTQQFIECRQQEYFSNYLDIIVGRYTGSLRHTYSSHPRHLLSKRLRHTCLLCMSGKQWDKEIGTHVMHMTLGHVFWDMPGFLWILLFYRGRCCMVGPKGGQGPLKRNGESVCSKYLYTIELSALSQWEEDSDCHNLSTAILTIFCADVFLNNRNLKPNFFAFTHRLQVQFAVPCETVLWQVGVCLKLFIL